VVAPLVDEHRGHPKTPTGGPARSSIAGMVPLVATTPSKPPPPPTLTPQAAEQVPTLIPFVGGAPQYGTSGLVPWSSPGGAGRGLNREVNRLLKVIQNPKLSGVQQVCCLGGAATYHKGRGASIPSGLLGPRPMETGVYMASQRGGLVGGAMGTATLHGRATDAGRSIVLGVTMFHAGDNKRLQYLCVLSDSSSRFRVEVL